MSAPQLIKVRQEKAADICRALTLEEESRALLEEGITPGAFLDRLLGREAYVDAIRFLAHALPKREATWWACLCARETFPPQPDAGQLAALQAAEAWVYKPTEENRRAALSTGEKIGSGTAAGWAALAAGWSGGSMGPASGPAITPGETLTPAAVAVAVIEASVSGGGGIQDKFRRFLSSGMDIASGGTGRPKAQTA
jgi:hypothetical protein